MSAHRCEHGTLISDQVGEYRCYECDPFGPADVRGLQDEVDQLQEENQALKATVRSVVRRLAHDHEICSNGVNPSSPCSCGLQALLDEVAG
jgi:hypothetical protein